MAKITMMSGIASISGRVGNCCFRTMKATGKVYMHQVNVQRDNVQCTKEPSEAMMRQRKDVRGGFQEKQKATVENSYGGV